MYIETMIDYIAKDYVWKLSQSKVNITSLKTNYLPHHRVININKPNRVQLVFDTVATHSGTSLN